MVGDQDGDGSTDVKDYAICVAHGLGFETNISVFSDMCGDCDGDGDSDAKDLVICFLSRCHILCIFCVLGAAVWAAKNILLRLASQTGFCRAAQFFLAIGADVNAFGRGGDTALMKASQSGRVQVARLLMDNGADLNLRNNQGRTAWEMALLHHQEIASMIHRQGEEQLALALF